METGCFEQSLQKEQLLTESESFVHENKYEIKNKYSQSVTVENSGSVSAVQYVRRVQSTQ